MKTEVLTFVIVLCVGLGLLVVEGFSASAQKKPKPRHISLPAPPSETEVAAPKAIDVYRSLSGKFVGCEDIDPERGVIIEHVSVGNTWRDEQQIGSMGRTIAVAPQNGFRHFTWSYMAGEDEDQYVSANCYDPFTGWETGPIQVDGGLERSSAYAHVQLMDYDPKTLARAEIPGMTYDRYEGDPPVVYYVIHRR